MFLPQENKFVRSSYDKVELFIKKNKIMKIIGTIPPQVPINSFASVVLEEEGNYYIQIIEDGLITDFALVNIENPESIIFCKEQIDNIKKNDKALYCFLYHDNAIICGTLDQLKPRLFEHLSDENFNPVVKNIICSVYQLHGKKILEINNQCNQYFQELEIHHREKFNVDDFIRDDDKFMEKYDENKEDPYYLGFYNVLVENEGKNIAYVFVNNYKMPLRDFFKKSDFKNYDYLEKFKTGGMID